jgi:hypothetical protein
MVLKFSYQFHAQYVPIFVIGFLAGSNIALVSDIEVVLALMLFMSI